MSDNSVKTLESFFKDKLGLTIIGPATPGFVQVDLAIAKSIVGHCEIGHCEHSSPIIEEDFTMDMGNYEMREIRKKIREFYEQFGYPIENVHESEFSDIAIKISEKETAITTSTEAGNNEIMISINIWAM